VQLDACPPNVIAHARMLTRMGRKPEARQQLSKAIAANQDNERNRSLLQGELVRLK